MRERHQRCPRSPTREARACGMSAAVVRPFSSHIDTARLISASPATGRNACRTLAGEQGSRNVESAVPGGSFSMASAPSKSDRERPGRTGIPACPRRVATGRNACRTVAGERGSRNVESTVPGGPFSVASAPSKSDRERQGRTGIPACPLRVATGRNACRTVAGERGSRNVESAVPGGSFSLARVPGMHYCAVPSVAVAEIHESEVFDFEYPPWIDLSKVTFFESREYPYG